MERIRTDLNTDDWSEIRCFGVSSGGAPALLAGTLLGAKRVLSICGRPPSISPEYGKIRGAIALEKCIRECSTDPERTSAVYAEGNRADKAYARQLAALMDLTLKSVPNHVDHNIIEPLHRRGELAAFLRTVGLLP